MSMARECDRCGELHRHEKGVVTFETIRIGTDGDGTSNTWSEVDFCPKCSAELLEWLGPRALQEFPPR
jgi:hypothetical protein